MDIIVYDTYNVNVTIEDEVVVGVSVVSGFINDVIAGTNITIDKSDPLNPVISSTGGDHPYTSYLGLYRIDTSGTASPSASGDVRYNNATQASATALYVSHMTADGVDIDLFLSLLTTGSALVVQDENESLNYQIFEISSTPSLAANTWTIPVTLNTSGGTGTTNFANNHRVFLATKGTGSGAALTNGSGTTANGSAVDLGGTTTSDVYIFHTDYDFYIVGGPGTVTHIENSSGLGVVILGDSAPITLDTGDVLTVKSTSNPTFAGAQYDIDYSANYTDRSLVDKAYVDANSGGGNGTGGNLFLYYNFY